MIQPIDIKTHKFKKGLFGYNASDVDTFIDAVYKAYDGLYKENEDLSSSLEKLNTSLQENRLKMFDMENEIQRLENSDTYGDSVAAQKKADEIIKNAEKTAAEIIARAKEQSGKFESGSDANTTAKATDKTEDKATIKFTVSGGKKSEANKESASSKFFKKTEENTSKQADNEDDDEIFVGEIEEARKPDRMMIGDGDEEEDMDFEFL